MSRTSPKTADERDGLGCRGLVCDCAPTVQSAAVFQGARSRTDRPLRSKRLDRARGTTRARFDELRPDRSRTRYLGRSRWRQSAEAGRMVSYQARAALRDRSGLLCCVDPCATGNPSRLILIRRQGPASPTTRACRVSPQPYRPSRRDVPSIGADPTAPPHVEVSALDVARGDVLDHRVADHRPLAGTDAHGRAVLPLRSGVRLPAVLLDQCGVEAL